MKFFLSKGPDNIATAQLQLERHAGSIPNFLVAVRRERDDQVKSQIYSILLRMME